MFLIYFREKKNRKGPWYSGDRRKLMHEKSRKSRVRMPFKGLKFASNSSMEICLWIKYDRRQGIFTYVKLGQVPWRTAPTTFWPPGRRRNPGGMSEAGLFFNIKNHVHNDMDLYRFVIKERSGVAYLPTEVEVTKIILSRSFFSWLVTNVVLSQILGLPSTIGFFSQSWEGGAWSLPFYLCLYLNLCFLVCFFKCLIMNIL